MARYVVKSDDPRRIAGAVIRYQVDRPTLWTAVIVACVLVGLGGEQAAGGRGALLAPVLVLVLVSLVIAYQRGRLAKTLRTRGYRPGAALDADFDDDGFTFGTVLGSTVHPYRDIADARLRNGIVVVRLSAERVVLALPVELVPRERFGDLADAADRREG